MTVVPPMTPKTTVIGALLACFGAAALISVLQLVELPGSGGWRSTNAVPAPVAFVPQTRGSNGPDTSARLDAGEISTARGRN